MSPLNSNNGNAHSCVCAHTAVLHAARGACTLIPHLHIGHAAALRLLPTLRCAHLSWLCPPAHTCR